MTSFVINAHTDRALPASWRTAPDCPFCRIVRGEGAAYKLYEDEAVIAILGSRRFSIFRASRPPR